MPQLITSVSNPRLKAAMALRNRRDREQTGQMLVEGIEELRVALDAGAKPLLFFECPALLPNNNQAAHISARARGIAGEHILLGEAAFEKLAYRDSPDGLLAVFPSPKFELPARLAAPQPLVLMMEHVEKPGNLGAMLRTADAAGVDLVIVCGEEGAPLADLTNPNVVRASKCALFTLNIASCSNAAAHNWLSQRGIRICAALPDAAQPYTSADMRGSLAVLLGEESRGLSTFWQTRADIRARIPMTGKVNSLNVSVAGALMLYEAKRQRIIGP